MKWVFLVLRESMLDLNQLEIIHISLLMTEALNNGSLDLYKIL